jgi:lysozyme family protein
MTASDIIADILRREGGFVNRADDPGGPTNMGITQVDLAGWRGHPVTVADVQNLTRQEAEDIYTHRYIAEPGFGNLQDLNLRALLVDSGVLCGTQTAIRFLQRALGVVDDGVLGPQTLNAVWRVPNTALYYRVCAERLRYFGRLITDNLTDKDRDGVPDNAEFAEGWLNRLAELIEEPTA